MAPKRQICDCVTSHHTVCESRTCDKWE